VQVLGELALMQNIKRFARLFCAGVGRASADAEHQEVCPFVLCRCWESWG
jgi:hypothetical protein